MDERHLQELIRIEQTYWWHVAKRALVLGRLARHCPPPGALVEGGVGAGGNLLAYQRMGYTVTGFDLSPTAVTHCHQLGLTDVSVHDLQTAWPVPAHQARAVVLLDVIEHAADPVAVLTHAKTALAITPPGAVVVTVPAIPALFGPWDEMLGHYRRYTRTLLCDHARQAGLRPVFLSYWNAFTLPPAWWVRRRERRQASQKSATPNANNNTNAPRKAEFPAVAAPVNALLKGLATVERGWMRVVPVPIGLSLVGVFQP